MTKKTAKKILRATYRLQFHPGFTFEDAAAAADYFSALGISHIYASPYLQAAHGSTHGYDVTDPTRVNRELGGQDGHKRLCRELERRGMGQVIDVVPNHMEIFEPFSNKWWWDVLEKGRLSKYAGFFDIDWDPPEKRIAGKIVLPVLEDHYGRVLEAGKFSVAITDTRQWVCKYHDLIFPLSPDSITSSSVSPARLNEDPDALDTVLQSQHYRLTYWRAASRDLNYRRFFAINSLAAVRAEDITVFKKTHALVLDWLGCGLVDGVRIDHPDGLKDPEGYLKRLGKAAPDAWIVVEKILHPGEELPASWPVSGTTGYDFLNQAAGLFIDSANESRFSAIYEEFTGSTTAYKDLIHACRHLVMEKLLGSDICRLTELLVNICEKHRCFRDHTRSQLTAAVKELLACMPVYRTYVRKNVTASHTDQEIIRRAVSEAKTRGPEIDPRLWGFLSDICCNRIKPETEADPEAEWMLRFQQTSGPVTAKGIEDTAFYRYNRLVCLNEVGGDPSVFGISVRQFHDAMVLRTQRCPEAMLATSTHDTKRSEDVRARLALLSEIPGHWEKAVKRWAAHNQTHKNQKLPDSNIEYLLYQSLVGAWPIGSERAAAFIQKAAREAAEYTCWEDPDTTYEQALLDFTKNILSDSFFVADITSFVTPLVNPGRINSLAQVLLKLTAPGVPDIYQGTELWDLSLVDPDNRRPVDFDRRRGLLASLEHMNMEQIMADMDSGLPKLYLIQKTLELRKDRPELFAPSASYGPVDITGTNHNHALAFTRGSRAVTIIPRLVMGFSGDWEDTRVNLSESAWQNIFTGETFTGPELLLRNILKKFPVALLLRADDKP
ncbi:MAG: malto-oligosyltrehalose synthase [Thermodesulfobacteriota bacterium]|nr:malto-oligosyltrehalose synthase [Thermodesulfobacteriota bacterium]